MDGAKDKLKGEAKDLYGKVTDNKDKQAEGKVDKAKGEAKQKMGEIKEKLDKETE